MVASDIPLIYSPEKPIDYLYPLAKKGIAASIHMYRLFGAAAHLPQALAFLVDNGRLRRFHWRPLPLIASLYVARCAGIEARVWGCADALAPVPGRGFLLLLVAVTIAGGPVGSPALPLSAGVITDARRGAAIVAVVGAHPGPSGDGADGEPNETGRTEQFVVDPVVLVPVRVGGVH